MKVLKDKLFALCIFRDILEDRVLDALFSHIKHPSVASYAEFVSRLNVVEDRQDLQGSLLMGYFQNNELQGFVFD